MPVGGPLASAAALAGAQLGGDGSPGPGGPRGASRLGWPQICRRLQDLKHPAVPSASTITAILHRQGCIAGAAQAGHKPFERFERAAPNELWQMDYKLAEQGGILRRAPGAAIR